MPHRHRWPPAPMGLLPMNTAPFAQPASLLARNATGGRASARQCLPHLFAFAATAVEPGSDHHIQRDVLRRPNGHRRLPGGAGLPRRASPHPFSARGLCIAPLRAVRPGVSLGWAASSLLNSPGLRLGGLFGSLIPTPASCPPQTTAGPRTGAIEQRHQAGPVRDRFSAGGSRAGEPCLMRTQPANVGSVAWRRPASAEARP